MIELSIHFTSEEKDETSPIKVSLDRRDIGTRTDLVLFEPPLGDPELAELRWYLELFSGWPTGPDYERAEGIKARLENWGRALLKSVIGGDEAPRLWQQFVDAEADGKLLTVDATDPRVLRLPWELLADESGHIFTQDISVRRRLRKVTSAKVKPFALPVRVLVVVSRPEGAGFIDPRNVSRPLLDALDELGDRVAVVEFLYPPTLKALTTRLRKRKAPPVHVVHFDGHGVYDVTLGLGYLLFEDDAYKENLVDADQLGTLLNRCGVPLMVLNACQSAKQQQEANPYASVAARLIRAGVGSVLAMNYSVLVVAARKFVAAFYGSLADGLTVGQAVDEGRIALHADEKRHTLTRRNQEGELVEETVTLRDWFLPALYQQAADPVVFHPAPQYPISSIQYPISLTDPTTPGGLPPDPLHGFHGRAREMLLLERALAEHRVVVLHGFGGMGKTALAAEAGRWFHRTGRFPGGAAFCSFERGGSLSQLCSWVGQAVSGDPDFVIHGDEGENGEDKKNDLVQRVAALLRERPAMVILDNFESALGWRPLMPADELKAEPEREPLMPLEELKAVLDAVWMWSGGKGARILITTRDTTFNDARFGPSKACAHIELGGLARDDALELAAAVLDDHGIDRARVGRQDLVDLMEHLGGHPLSLYLVLPHLRQYTPAELTARFEELLPGFTTGAAVERNESLQVSLQFSLDRLGDETRAALPDLAVFQGSAFEDDMLAITGMDPDLWGTARAELEQAALVTAESLPGVTPPFLRFHPTLVPYLASLLPAARRAELEKRYWQRYYALADYLDKADIQTPHQARAIAQRELPNLRRALDLAIAASAAAEAVEFATYIAKFLDDFGRWRERDTMMEKISHLQSQISSKEGLTKAEYLMLSQRGDVLLQHGQAADAERLFRELLAKIEAGMAYSGDEAAYDRGCTLMRLGRCLAAQGRPAQAIEWHRQALEEFERISESSESAKKMMAVCGTDLADNLAAIGQFDDAQRQYETALNGARETDNQRQVGVVLGQLGTLALLRGDLAEAARRCAEALETFRALGEPQSEAVIWHQLGMVARRAKDWDEAERCYRESARICEQIRDLPGLAREYNSLALVAEDASRPDDAERWYLRAIELGEELRYYAELGKWLSNLANLYLSQGRLDEAARYAHRALEIDEAIGDPSVEIWQDYAILAQIAEAQGRADEAAQWRRKEQESYAAYAGAAHEIRQYQPLIQAVVAACQGSEEARRQLEPVLQRMENADEVNRRFAQAARRILAGERDAETLIANLERIGATMVHTILAQLAGETPQTPGVSTTQTSGVLETPGVSEAVAQLRQQWTPVVQAVVAACQGDAAAAGQLEPLLSQFSQQDDWRHLAAALRRILSGERDPAALLPGLDATDTLIAGDVLRALGVDLTGFGNLSGLSLDDLLDLVALACRPDAPPGLAEQLHAATRTMAADPNAPSEIRALGSALNAILSGDRDPDLSALPPELAEALRRLLSTIT